MDSKEKFSTMIGFPEIIMKKMRVLIRTQVNTPTYYIFIWELLCRNFGQQKNIFEWS